ASEPEFFGKYVEGRKQYLRQHDLISFEQFRDRRPFVIERLAAGLEAALATGGAAPQLQNEPEAGHAALPDDGGGDAEEAATGSDSHTLDPAQTAATNTAAQLGHRKPAG